MSSEFEYEGGAVRLCKQCRENEVAAEWPVTFANAGLSASERRQFCSVSCRDEYRRGLSS